MEIPGTLLSHKDATPFASRISNILQYPKAANAFPGAQPISFEEKHSQMLLEKDYFVSEKADGIRVLLYSTIVNLGSIQCPNYTPIVILIDRKNDYYKINGFGLVKNHNAYLVDTVVDGELIYDKTSDGSQILFFLIFDALIVNGKLLLDRPYTSRLGYLRELVLKPYLEKVKKDPNYKKTHSFEIRQKKVEPSYHMDKVFEQVELYKHESDGLIFTSADAGYHPGTCETMVKWKPPSENTVDFLLQVNKTVQGDKYFISVFYGAKGYQIESDFEFGSDFEKVKGERLHGRIIECKYDANWPFFWRFSRFRDDKPDANHVSVFKKVQKSIQDNVTREKLLAIRGKIEVAWKEREAAKKAGKRSHQDTDNSLKDRVKKASITENETTEKAIPKDDDLTKVSISDPVETQQPENPEKESVVSKDNDKSLAEKELLSVDFD